MNGCAVRMVNEPFVGRGHFVRRPVCFTVLYGQTYILSVYAVSYIAKIYDLAYIVPLEHIMAELARTPRQLGNLIRRARKNQGLSQSELGARTGLRQATISEIETGHRSAKLDSILTVLASLNLEIRIDPRSIGSSTDIESLF
jgi:HTH-type transcriptional regulator/antitoxin HipB